MAKFTIKAKPVEATVIKPLKRVVLFPNPYKETMASACIAKWIADTLGVELWDSKEKIRYEEIDELYFVFGMVAFSTFREEMGALHPYVKKYIYIENDFLGCHLTQLRKPLRERGMIPIMLTTCPHRLIRGRGWYVNWNQLSYNPLPEDQIAKVDERYKAMVYYGFYRDGRDTYFRRYMATDKYEIHVCSGKGGQRKFKAVNPMIATYDQQPDLRTALNTFAFTLYIEDEFSHTHFSSIACRFYECLNAGIPILFDKSTIGTMDKGGFDVRPFVVESPEDVVAMMPRLQEIQDAQASWRKRNYREETRVEFLKLVEKIGRTDSFSWELPK